MSRNMREFDINGEKLAVIEVHGPSELQSCLLEFQQAQAAEKPKDVVDSQKPQDMRGLFTLFGVKPLEKPLNASPEVHQAWVILYVNSNQHYANRGQESLIVLDGINTYFCDLVRGVAPTIEIEPLLPANCIDIGKKIRADVMRQTQGDVGKTGELIHQNLKDLPQALRFAYQEIQEKQKAPQSEPVMANQGFRP